jgi:hypothetical protein
LWVLSGRAEWPERIRSWFLFAAYLIGPLWLVSRQTVVSAVALVILGGAVLWLAQRGHARPTYAAATAPDPVRSATL